MSSVFPSENKKSDEPYADLLKDLTALGVNTPEDAVQIFNRHITSALEADRERVAEIRAEKDTQEGADVLERVSRGIFFAHVGLAREALRKEFGDKKVGEVIASRDPKRKRQTKQAG